MRAYQFFKRVTHVARGLPCARRAHAGNALLEYAVPAVALLLASGVILTLSDISGLMSNSYVLGTGHPTSSLVGTTLKTNGLGDDAIGDIGNGEEEISEYGSLSGGNSGHGYFVTGAAVRSGGRPTASDSEALFPPS